MRDTQWLARVLQFEADRAPSGEVELYGRAIAAVRRYPRAASGETDGDAAWDEVLTAIDSILVVRQAAHVAAVRAAGRSGMPPDAT